MKSLNSLLRSIIILFAFFVLGGCFTHEVPIVKEGNISLDTRIYGVWKFGSDLSYYHVERGHGKTFKIKGRGFDRAGELKGDTIEMEGFAYQVNETILLAIEAKRGFGAADGKWGYFTYHFSKAPDHLTLSFAPVGSGASLVEVVKALSSLENTNKTEVKFTKSALLNLEGKVPPEDLRVYNESQVPSGNLDSSTPNFTKPPQSAPAKALYDQAKIHLKEDAPESDEQKAFQLMLKAAEQGLLKAQTDLGMMYSKGIGTAKDPKLGFHWTEKAAIGGRQSAQHNLAYLYKNGKGTSQNAVKALYWYGKSAENPESDSKTKAESSHNMGLLYKYGDIGVPKDLSKARMHFESAADSGYIPSQLQCGEFYKFGYGMKSDLPRALAWYEKAARAGASDGQLEYGKMLFFGIGVKERRDEGVEWIKKAADQKNDSALFFFSSLYFDGGHFSKNKIMALHYAKLAAEAGNTSAILIQSSIFAEGDLQIGTGGKYYELEKDEVRAFELLKSLDTEENLEKIVAEGIFSPSDIYYKIAFAYYHGKGTRINLKQAFLYFKKSSDAGDADAVFMVGFFYENGYGVAKNSNEALKYYVNAKNLGSKRAGQRIFDLEHPVLNCTWCKGKGSIRVTAAGHTERCGHCGGAGKIRR